MEIHLEFEESDAADARLSVAIDGTICGLLSMPSEKAVKFAEIVKQGCKMGSGHFNMSGKTPVSEDWVLWHKRSGIERREMEESRSGVERRSTKNRRTGK